MPKNKYLSDKEKAPIDELNELQLSKAATAGRIKRSRRVVQKQESYDQKKRTKGNSKIDNRQKKISINKEKDTLEDENEIELDGKLHKNKIKFYCQFCLNEQSKTCSKIDLNKDDLKKKFYEFTGKELDTLKFSEFICCDPCFQMFLDSTEYRRKLLSNQRILLDLFNSENSEIVFNKSETDFFENVDIKDEPDENVVIKEEEVVTPQCFTCHEVLSENHNCLPIPAKKKKSNEVQKIIYLDKKSKVPITCDGCDKKFTKRVSFSIHFRNHHIKSSNVICHQCGKLFNNERQLKRHMYNHNEKLFKCDQCPKTFKHPSNVKRHQMSHSSVKPFSCPICQRGYTQKVTMMLHIKSFHNKKFKCDGCGKTYDDKKMLEKHVRRHVKSDPRPKNKVYECIVQDCEYSSQWRRAIGVHLEKVHEMSFEHFERTCLECFHVSDNPGTHVIHMKTHSCKFTCEFCRQSFKTDKILQSHVAKYHGRLDEDRPFVCDFPDCGAKFKRAAHLQSHRSFRHLAERKFACDHCDMTFHYHQGYVVHMRIHTDSNHNIKSKMGRKCELSEDQRLLVVELSKQGKSLRKIRDETGIEWTTARHIVKKFKEYGTVKNLSRSGRKRKTTPALDQIIVSAVKKDRFPNAVEISKQLKEVHGIEIHPQTVRNRLHEHDLIHTDSKPYQCWICDFKCRASSGMQTHMRLSHKESRIYSCKYCSMKFEQHTELTQHEKTKH